MNVSDPLLQELREVASQRRTISYGDLVGGFDLDMSSPADRLKIGEMLGAISESEHQQGRPLISAVVVHRDTGDPGKGFFKLARRLHKFDGRDPISFFAEELRRVHELWENQSKLPENDARGEDMLSSVDGIVQDSIGELISTLEPNRLEKHYQERLATLIFERIRRTSELSTTPHTVDDLREHGNMMSYWPDWKGGSSPCADLFIWRPKDSHRREYLDVLALSNCVAVELKVKDGDANQGKARLKWLSHACKHLGLPVPPDDTDGRDYTETESTLIALRAYRNLVGVGKAYLLLVGFRGNFKLRLLKDRVRIFEDGLWQEAPSSGTSYLFQEISTLWD